MPPAPPGFYNPPGTQMFIPQPASKRESPSSAPGSSDDDDDAGSDKTLLVTTGATAPFPALVDAVLSRDFLRSLRAHGITRLALQAGAYHSSPQFRTLLAAAVAADEGVRIDAFDFAADLARDHICRAHVVVSHAGAGSVLDALRWDRPLVVVENRGLMGSHQRELVDELRDYLVEGSLEEDGGLQKAVARAILRKTAAPAAARKPFPPSGSGRLVAVLEEELGVMKEG
jgi:beta-1,4-N-acetylglucosaminyltransferase